MEFKAMSSIKEPPVEKSHNKVSSTIQEGSNISLDSTAESVSLNASISQALESNHDKECPMKRLYTEMPTAAHGCSSEVSLGSTKHLTELDAFRNHAFDSSYCGNSSGTCEFILYILNVFLSGLFI